VKDRFQGTGMTAREGRSGSNETQLIWGLHAAEAALANPARRIETVWLTENAANRLSRSIMDRRIVPEKVSPRDLDRRLGSDTVHQGVLLDAGPLPEGDLFAMAAAAVDVGPLLMLDQVTDPHNVGAVLRSAAVFGSAGVVMTRRNSPPL